MRRWFCKIRTLRWIPCYLAESLIGTAQFGRILQFTLSFAERVALKPVVVMPSALSSGEGLGGNFLARVFWRRIGHDMPQTDQPVIRRGVQIETKQVGHVAMIAQPVRL